MMFDLATRTILQHYTANPPPADDHWYGPWTSILTTLFPTSQGYMVMPQRRIPEDSQSHIPDFVIEVAKFTTPPIQLGTVLIVKVKGSQHWQAGIPSLERQIKRQTDAAFSGSAVSQVYWIGVIGPHWRYGIKEDDGQDPRPLIPWHDITHDQDSYTDLQALVALVAAM